VPYRQFHIYHTGNFVPVQHGQKNIGPTQAKLDFHAFYPCHTGTFFGCIPYKTEFKYLGVILDQKLTWNAHSAYVCSKAIRAYWTCNRLFGKTRSLRHKLIYWYYTSIVGAILTYAVLVWWPKVKDASAQKLLSKVQSLSGLPWNHRGPTGTCQTAAMETIIGLIPLLIFVKKIAATSALELQRKI
jgi:hypothetical protein